MLHTLCTIAIHGLAPNVVTFSRTEIRTELYIHCRFVTLYLEGEQDANKSTGVGVLKGENKTGIPHWQALSLLSS
jgi:hypothetical protein